MYYSKCYMCIPEPLYHYNRTNASSMVAKSSELQDEYTESMITIYSRINDFFKEIGLYSQLEKVLSWRMLSAKKGMLKNPAKREKYLTLFPESNRYIDENPLCVAKDKLYQHIIVTPVLYRVLYANWICKLVDVLEMLIKRIK